jgi:hypothetical protein
MEVTGYFALRGLRDEATSRVIGPAGGQSSSQTTVQSDLRATALVYLSTRSFIYHPNFLTLDLGAGPIYQDASFRTEIDGSVQQETRARKSLYDAVARATFLRDMPYTGSVYYEHLNPYVMVGPAEVLVQENTRTGASLALLDPATPVPLNLEAQKLRSKGESALRRVDDVTDLYSLSASRGFGRYGDSRLRLSAEQLESRGGSTGLPVVPSRRRNDSAGLDTRLQFGTDNKYRLTNVLSYGALSFEQGQIRPADRRDKRFFLDMQARPSTTLLAYASFDAGEVRQAPLKTNTRAATAGTTVWPVKDLGLTLEARGDDLKSTDVDVTRRGGLAAANYEVPALGGKLLASYSARYDDWTQRAQSLTTPVIGERVTLSGLSFVALARPRVVQASVRVTNEARTQVYVLGLDYTLSVLGETTRLQRIASGQITDGQTVLVDYEFEVGGTFNYTQLDQNGALQLSWGGRFSLYTRWFDSRPTLKEGVPLRVLNTVRSTLVGARTDLPLGSIVFIGGSVEVARRTETILPSTSRGADAYLQIDEALLGPGGLRLGVRRQRVDYELVAAQDVDLTGYDLRYWTHTPWGIEFELNLARELDTGGAIERRRDYGTLRARWRFRQLNARLDINRTRELQGAVETTRAGGTFLLQRDF